jgi:DNA mismatch repair protein Mlh1 C-terminus
MTERLPVRELIALALDHPDACYDADKHLPKEELIEHYASRLAAKADMLEDFFAIKFGQEESKDNDDLCLEALPIVVDGI